MKTRTTRAITIDRNSFNQTSLTDLGFDKTTYTVTVEEFLKTELPDTTGYGSKANDTIRSLMRFEAWENPNDCRYVVFDVTNGKICNVSDVDFDTYKSSINFVEIED